MAKTIYISGKITGLPEQQARDNFAYAEQLLRREGWEVINPFDIDLKEKEKTWANFMLADIEALIPCDAIFMLKDWMDSNGAYIEHAFARAMEKEIYYQSSLMFEEVSNG